MGVSGGAAETRVLAGSAGEAEVVISPREAQRKAAPQQVLISDVCWSIVKSLLPFTDRLQILLAFLKDPGGGRAGREKQD